MRFTCAAVCVLAAPEVVSFHVAVPNALPRDSFAPAAATSSFHTPRATLHSRNTARAAVDSTTSRMSTGIVSVDKQDGKARRLATLLSASAIVADASGVGEEVSGGASDEDMVVSAEKKSKLFRVYEKGAEYFTNLFPVWLTLFSFLALKDPSMFAWFTTE